MKIADILAQNPNIITGQQLLERHQANRHACHTAPSVGTANTKASKASGAGVNDFGATAKQSEPTTPTNGTATASNEPTAQNRQNWRQGQRLPRHHTPSHHRPPKTAYFAPQKASKGKDTTHTQNTAKNAQNGANNACFGNRPHTTKHTDHQPHNNAPLPKADFRRLPSPLDFYSRFLTVKGGGLWRTAICPFHNDTRPSLAINTTHGGYICHTCGAKGDMIGFYMKKFGVDFVQACQALNLYDD